MKTTRLFYVLSQFPLLCVDFVAPRLYMSLKLRLLVRSGVKISGRPRYIAPDVKFDEFARIALGDRVVISKRVTLLTHDYSLTTALRAIGEPPTTDLATHSDIVIGDNVFIGMNSMLLPGTRIDSNVIVGAGSVVRGRIASGSILAGNPAQRISQIEDREETWRARRVSPSTTRDSR